MTDEGESTVETTVSPDEAFALVSDETRVAILRSLWESDSGPLSFSTLRKRVGMRDSGQFSYHLEKLTGAFVRKTDEGYELATAGVHTMAAVSSGAYTASTTVGPVSVDGACIECGGDLAASYENELAEVFCVDCDLRLFGFPLVPGAVADYEPAKLPDLLDRWTRVTIRQLNADICPICDGRLHGRLEDSELTPEQMLTTVFECRRHGGEMANSLSTLFAEHPAAVRFYEDHGHDPSERPVWSLAHDFTAEWDDDHDRAVVSLTVEDDTLAFVVDEALTVVETRRPESER